MLIIPFTGEQYRNGMRVEREGNGAMMLFDDITAQSLADKIIEITTSTTYFPKAKEQQTLFLSTPLEPSKEAIFYIEVRLADNFERIFHNFYLNYRISSKIKEDLLLIQLIYLQFNFMAWMLLHFIW